MNIGTDLAGKTIESVERVRSGHTDKLKFVFTDGTELCATATCQFHETEGWPFGVLFITGHNMDSTGDLTMCPKGRN